MPKCIVDYCRNYAGMRKNYANVILHGFPTTLDRIKLWLRAIEQSGQIFENLDEMAEKIHEGKKYDSYRVCSEHFTIQCYFVNGDKKILKKESIPTVFANRHAVIPFVPRQIIKRKKQEPLNTLAKKKLKKKATGSLKENKEAAKPKNDCKKKPKKFKNGQELAQKLLNLTLEIITLLTGEDYIVVKKSCPQVKLDRRTQCSKMVPQSRMLDWVNEHKILELTNMIIELITAEEQNNIEGHKEASTDVKMQNVPSPGVFQETETEHPWFSSSNSMDVETVIVEDAECFKISTWTAISEVNGTKKLVLCEDSVVQGVDPNDVQNSSTRVVGEPLLSEGGNLQIYPQDMSIKEEPLPHKEENQPHTDLYKDLGIARCSSIKTEEYEGTIPTPDHGEHITDYVAKDPITSNGQNLPEMDITEQSDHKQDSSTHIKEETQSLPPLDNDHLQYTSVIINEEHLLPSEANLHIPDTYTPDVPLQCTALVIKEEPGYCEQHHFTHIDVAKDIDRTQRKPSIINEEPGYCEDHHFTHTDTAKDLDRTQRKPLSIKEEPGYCEAHHFTHTDTAKDIDQTQRKPPGIKEEPNSSVEENFTHSSVHTAPSNTHCIFYTTS